MGLPPQPMQSYGDTLRKHSVKAAAAVRGEAECTGPVE
jgi:hypothetical protein